jgi:hypothetical protein
MTTNSSRFSYNDIVQPSKAHGINENKKFTGFLGGITPNIKNDPRPELFISQLRAAATENKATNNSQLPYKPGKYINTAPSNIVDTRSGIITAPAVRGFDAYSGTFNHNDGDVCFKKVLQWMEPSDSMYNDWLMFLCQLTTRLSEKTHNDIFGSLDFIRGLKSIQDPGEYMFAVAVVKTFVKELNDGSSNVINDHPKWDTVQSVNYYLKGDILNNLFNNRISKIPTQGSKSHTIIDEGPVNPFHTAVVRQACADLYNPREFDKYNYEKYCNKVLENIIKEVQVTVNNIVDPEKPTDDPTLHLPSIVHTLAGSQPIPTPPDDKYRYIRKADKELYIVSEGKETLASKFKSDVKATTRTCEATGFNAAECDNFFFSCISGTNLAGCSKFLQDNTFWVKGSIEFLEKVNLYLAHIALQKYKIPIVQENGLKMYKIDKWHAKLDDLLKEKNDGLDQPSVDAIKKNAELNALLLMVTTKINEWPAILNEDYIQEPTKPDTIPQLPSLTAYLTKRQYTSQPLVSIPNGTVPGLIEAKALQMQERIKEILRRVNQMIHRFRGVSGVLGIPGIPGALGMPGVLGVPGLHGGAGGTVVPFNTWGIGPQATHNKLLNYGSNAGTGYDFYQDHLKIKESLDLIQAGLPLWLESAFKNRFAGLEAKGHKIAESDVKSINKVLKYVKDIERFMLMGLHTLTKYGFFMDSDLIPFLLATYNDDKPWVNEVTSLVNLHTKTAGSMIKLVELIEKKLGKYCEKVGKLGGVCETLGKM